MNVTIRTRTYTRKQIHAQRTIECQRMEYVEARDCNIFLSVSLMSNVSSAIRFQSRDAFYRGDVFMSIIVYILLPFYRAVVLSVERL